MQQLALVSALVTILGAGVVNLKEGKMEENKKTDSSAGQNVEGNQATETTRKSRSGCALWSITGIVALLGLAGALYYAYAPAEKENKESVIEKKTENKAQAVKENTTPEQENVEQGNTENKNVSVQEEAGKVLAEEKPKTVEVSVDVLKDLQQQIADLKKQVAEKQNVPVNQGGTTIIVNAQRSETNSTAQGGTYGYQKDGTYRAKTPAEMLLSSQRLMDTMPATSDYTFSQNGNGTVEHLTVRSNRAVTDITTVNGKVVQRQGQVSGFYSPSETGAVRKAVILPTTVSTKEMDVSKTNVRVYGD